MTTTKLSYPATAVAVIWTPESLADGSFDFSAEVSNRTNLDLDHIIGGTIKAGTTPTLNNTIDIYIAATFDGGATFSAGVSGSDGGTPGAAEEGQLILVKVIKVDATTAHEYEFGPISIASLFGGIMPSGWCIGCQNNSGVALNATLAGVVTYDRVQSTNA